MILAAGRKVINAAVKSNFLQDTCIRMFIRKVRGYVCFNGILHENLTILTCSKLIPEPKAQSAFPGVSPGRELLIVR